MDQAWNRSPAKHWVKEFILPHKHHASNSYRRFCKLPKNVKTNSNTTGSYLVSCRVMPRSATVKE